MALAARKRAELTAKAASLDQELAAWRGYSAATGPLEKHQAQIDAVATVLHGVVASASARLGDAEGDDERLLDAAPQLESLVLDAHRLWEFFRSKLALRWVPWFADYLTAADELAWACYEPAQLHDPDGYGKEPPLVFLNGGSSPFTLARGSSFAAEQVPGGGPDHPALRTGLRKLPVPVIGVPWFQVAHLPDLPVIGHEVGHDVEQDLELGPTLDALLDAALADVPPDRRDAWRAWRSELFADVYGTLATGAAFAGCLIDFLARGRNNVEDEWVGNGSWGAHPTATLRVLACVRVLERLGLDAVAAELAERWTCVYASHRMTAFEPDVAVVVDAILAGPYPELADRPLTSLLTVTPALHETMRTTARDILGQAKVASRGVRTTLAGLRLAYELDPDAYARKRCGDRVLHEIVTTLPSGARGTASTAVPVERHRDERDRAITAEILELLAERGRNPPQTAGGTDV